MDNDTKFLKRLSDDIINNRRLIYNLIMILVSKKIITMDEAKEIEKFLTDNEEG